MKLYMFRTVRLSIIRSLFTVHSAMVYVIQICRQLSSRTSWFCSKAVLVSQPASQSVSQPVRSTQPHLVTFYVPFFSYFKTRFVF